MSEERNDTDTVVVNSQPTTSTHIVTAESVQAEEVPTVPLDSLQTISSLQPEISVHSTAATRNISTPVPLVSLPGEYRRSLVDWIQVWWEGTRPTYFVLPLMPALLGSVLAWTQSITTAAPFGSFRITHFVGMILALLFIQAGANLINDYYDYLRGIDTGNSFGPGGLLQQGLVKPTRLLYVALSLLLVGAVLGLIIAATGGPLVYLMGLIGLVCAYFYSATTRSLSSLALGELVAFVIFGPLVTLGAYLIEGGKVPAGAFAYSVPLGLFAAAVVHINNLRDTEGDTQANKHTIAALLGLGWSRIWALILLLVPFAVVTLLAFPHNAPHLILLAWWTLPTLVVALTGILRTDTSVGFHLAMRQVLRLEVAFTILILLALAILAIIPVLPHLPAKILPF